jgi:hypothetical protein
VTQLSERASQYRSELEKQSSARAAQVESLLTAGDYEAIREWLDQWEAEDNARNSLYQKYRSVRQELREERYRQRQQRLYGSVIDKITGKAKASTKDLTRPGADYSQTTAANESLRTNQS